MNRARATTATGGETGGGRRRAPIKIAFLASTLPTGGAEIVTLNLFQNIDRDRFDAKFLFLKAPGVVGERLLAAGYGGQTHLQTFRFDPLVVPRLTAALRSYSPDILFILNCHRNAMLWGGLCGTLTRVPVRIIATHHTGTLRGPKNYASVDRLFLGSTTSIIALSERHADYIRDVDGVDPGKIDIIANGIHTSKFEMVDKMSVLAARESIGLENGDRVVIMLAGLRPEKAHTALLGAAHLLVPTRPELKFLVVGDGPLRAELEVEAQRLDLVENVLFLGERRDVNTLLHLSDVMVLPSHPVVETLPLSVMESMAAGVPVVASAVGSVPDMIADGVNGRLIPPADASELASAISWVLDDDARARGIRDNALKTVRERYTVARMVSRYEALFERLVAQKQPRAGSNGAAG